MAEATKGVVGQGYLFQPDASVRSSSTGEDFVVEPEPEIPLSFFEGLRDIKEGKTVDLDTALNEPYPGD